MDLKKIYGLDVKQKDLIEKSGLTPSVVSKMLRGADVKFSSAMKLCIASKGKIKPMDLYKNLVLHKNQESRHAHKKNK